MRITLTSVFVEDQDQARSFYTEILGFEVKTDVPVGAARFLTVVSPEGPDDVALLLEPNASAGARAFQEARFRQGIPATSFATEDVEGECARLEARGVVFRVPPTRTAWGCLAIFEDTCGNLIQLHEG